MKKDFTLDELKEQYKTLGEQIEKREKEEEESRKAKLEEEKSARKAEVDLAEKTYRELLSAYVKDYGRYDIVKTKTIDGDELPSIFRMFF